MNNPTNNDLITTTQSGNSQGSFFSNLPFRVKLIVTFLSISLLSLIILGFANNRMVRAALQTEINQVLLSAASETAEKIDNFINANLSAVRIEAQIPTLTKYLSLPADQQAGSPQEADAAATLRALSLKDQLFIVSYALLDSNGFNVLDTNAAAATLNPNESDQEYFYFPFEQGRPFVSPVTFTREGNGFIHFSSPVRDTSGQIIGVLRVRYNANILQQLIAENNDLVGEGSFGILLDENYLRLADGEDTDELYTSIAPLSAEEIISLRSQKRLPQAPNIELLVDLEAFLAGVGRLGETPFFTAKLHNDAIVETAAAIPIETQPWIVVFGQHEDTIIAPIRTQTQTTVIALLILGVIVTAAAFVLGQTLARPLVKLTAVAQQVAEGNLDVQAPVQSTDEAGQLAAAFNFMTSRIRNLVNTLEERVAARTRDLKLSSEVARQVTTQLTIEELLPQFVEQTREAFDLYFAAVTLYDKEAERLRIAAATGRAGEQMLANHLSYHIEARPSLVAKAGREKQHILINDVTQEPSFDYNTHLPDTQSELVLPLLVGDNLIGVLDIQSEAKDRFTPADEEIFTTLAEQIAIAVNNAQLYAIQRQLAEELRQADIVKNQFLASMSHELRTPLNGIMNFTEMVSSGMMGDINNEQKELLEQSLDSSKHLLSLINDVLDITKIQAGKLNLFIEDNVNIYDELSSVTNLIQPMLRENHVTLVQEIDNNLPLLRGDRRRIRQILLNLAANAAKFTREGTITIKAENQQNEQILFTVIDTGSGIPEEMRDIIFEPFIQTVEGIKHAQGTGLGLPITKSLVEAHGGRIWVESAPNQGSAFYIILPIQIPETKPSTVITEG